VAKTMELDIYGKSLISLKIVATTLWKTVLLSGDGKHNLCLVPCRRGRCAMKWNGILLTFETNPRDVKTRKKNW
jgi:hypothetical protein